MLVKHHGKPKSKKERFEQKLEIVMRWMAEHEFTAIEVMTIVLGQKSTSAYRFFDKLLKRKYVVRFYSISLHRADLIRIGVKGVEYIKKEFGIDKRRALRSDEFSRRVRLGHDLHLQKYLAQRWTKFGNIYGEKNIHAEQLRPDALLVGSVRDGKVTFFDLEKWDLIRKWDKPDIVKEREKQAQYDPQRYMWANPNAPIAVECERTRRGGRKFFLKLNSYIVAMAEGRVSQVVFVFDSESLMHEFEEKFKRAEWPRPHVDPKSGKLLRGDLHTVSLDHPIRKRVHFRFTEPLGSQVIRIRKRPRKPLSREKVASAPAS